MSPAQAQAVLTVNTTTDARETAGCGNATGLCSLRGAIDLANATANVDAATPDTIRFNIAGTGPHVIPVGQSDYNGRGFSAITEAVVIDGTSEPDYDAANGVPVVVLHDHDGGYSINGLQLTDHTGSTVTGLSITGFTGFGGVGAIRIKDGGTHTVVRNDLGVRPDGTVRANDYGVRIEDSAGNRIDRNRIRGSNATGIVVSGDASVDNRITQNEIYGSGYRAIDLGADGLTNNDGSRDADTGPNTLLNMPVIRSASYAGGQLSVTYEVPTGSTPVDVEFFLASTGAQAERYLGTDTYSGSGAATASIPVSSLPSPFEIVATATDASGNTSELGIQLPTRSGTYTVTSTADSGPGSLRRAIRAANDDPTANTIAFDIAGSSPHTIAPGSILPKLFGPVTVDGTTEPDYRNEAPVIVIDGGNLTYKYAKGLEIEAGGASAVRGLAIVNVNSDALNRNGIGLALVDTDYRRSSNDTFEITGNYFGVLPDGTTAAPNWVGLEIDVPYTTVGGANAAARNVVSGNIGTGIRVSPGVYATTILGNYIGVTSDGVGALGNGGSGLHLSNTGVPQIGRIQIGGPGSGDGNVIADNGLNGIHLHGRGIDVYGNHIGVNVNEEPLGNGSDGIKLYYGSNNNRIGGVGAGEGNIIAHNDRNGVYLYYNGRAAASTTSIRGNAIYLNRRLGIELGGGKRNEGDGDGINRNDAVPYNLRNLFSYIDDADEGANQQQNYPEVTSFNLDPAGNSLTVTYRVPSDPAHTKYPLAVDFYEAQFDVGGQPSDFFFGNVENGDKSVPVAVAPKKASITGESIAKTAYTGSGTISFVIQIPVGEGGQYLATDTYTEADYRNGDGTKTVTIPLQQAPKEASSWIIGTATDANQNTSEFSFPFYVFSWPAGGAIGTTTSKASSDPAAHRFETYDVTINPSYTAAEWTVAVNRTMSAPEGTLPNGRELANYGSWTFTPADPAVAFETEVCLDLNALTRDKADIDFTALEVWRRPDAQTAWSNLADDPAHTVVSESNYYGATVCIDGLSALGEFVVVAAPSALPVELAGFSAQRDGATVRLTWQTAAETNNAGFHLERAVGSGPFAEIGFVGGAGTTETAQSYRFTDTRLPFAADSLTYRLRQVDLDGTTAYSDPVVVPVGAPDRLTLHAPFPNPARESAILRYELPPSRQTTDVSIRVYNVLGQQVATLGNGVQPSGRVEYALDTSRWPSGLYFVRLQAGGEIHTQRLVVVR